MTTITVINPLAVKPGRIDEFIASQRAFANAMCSRHVGLLGGRMYRNEDGSKTVLISLFESRESQSVLMRSAEFQAYLARMREMVDSSAPEPFQEAYTYGAFE